MRIKFGKKSFVTFEMGDWVSKNFFLQFTASYEFEMISLYNTGALF